MAVTFSTASDYAKILALKSQKSCDCESDCDCPTTEVECGCCPPGLVSVTNENDEQVGCLTPTDALAFNQATKGCKEGFLRAIAVDGTFIGCVEPTDYLALKTAGAIAVPQVRDGGVLTVGVLAINHATFITDHEDSVEGDIYLKLLADTAVMYKLIDDVWTEQCVFGEISYSL